MTSPHIFVGIVIILASSFNASPSIARDNRHHEKMIVGRDGLPSIIPGLGTFSGGIAAVKVKGNGIYFASGNFRRIEKPYQAPKARIIEVSRENPENACSFEAGVCVIRP